MGSFGIDSRFYRLLEKVTSGLLLNILWLLSCLPIITIFPATVAMFAVVRGWNQEKKLSIFKNYFRYFKSNFMRSFVYGMIWFILALLFYFNMSISLEMTGVFGFLMVAAIACFSLLFIMTSIFLFPIIVHYEMTAMTQIRNAFLFSVTQITTTLFCGLIVFISIIMSYIWPISIFIIWSMAADHIYRQCDRSFKKMEAMAQSTG